MRRFFLSLALIAAVAGFAAGSAAAKEHEGHGGHGAGGRGGGAPPWAHGGAAQGPRAGPAPGPGPGQGGWSRGGGGRWERPAAVPPPEAAMPAPRGYYGAPRRGGYLPPQERGGVVQDYGRYRLRPPPPGYGWVRSGRSLMLMDMGTGQVFDVIPD
jgi:Ni/Co efflux regulator RcnB